MELVQEQLLANLNGPVRSMLIMIIGVMLTYGLMFYAFGKVRELLSIAADEKLESTLPGIGGLQAQRSLANQHKGTAAGDVYSYQYKQDMKEFTTKRDVYDFDSSYDAPLSVDYDDGDSEDDIYNLEALYDDSEDAHLSVDYDYKP